MNNEHPLEKGFYNTSITISGYSLPLAKEQVDTISGEIKQLLEQHGFVIKKDIDISCSRNFPAYTNNLNVKY